MYSHDAGRPPKAELRLRIAPFALDISLTIEVPHEGLDAPWPASQAERASGRQTVEAERG
jgi:hypothetical protein